MQAQAVRCYRLAALGEHHGALLNLGVCLLDDLAGDDEGPVRSRPLCGVALDREVLESDGPTLLRALTGCRVRAAARAGVQGDGVLPALGGLWKRVRDAQPGALPLRPLPRPVAHNSQP